MSGHDHHANGHGQDADERFWRTPAGIAFTVFATVAALYLLFEHWLHLLGALPWLLLLLCPVMHVFLHKGHHGPGGGQGGANDA